MPSQILIVEDDPVQQMIVSSVVTQHTGARCITAKCGAAGLAVIEAAGDDLALILLDIHMEGCDGVEVLMRMAEIGCQTDVVVLSGSEPYLHRIALLARAYGINLQGTLQKPLDDAGLILIKELVAKHPKTAGYKSLGNCPLPTQQTQSKVSA